MKITDKTIWVTRDKRRIKFGDMTDDHIENCIAFLKRKRARLVSDAGYAFAYVGGELAEDAAQEVGMEILDEVFRLEVMINDISKYLERRRNETHIPRNG